MAEASELSKTDSILRSTRLFVDDIPRVAEDWAAWDDDIQADFTFDWMGVMDHLIYVTERVASGIASPAQVAAYAAIQADLRAAEPTLRALEVQVPAEILAAVPPAERRVPA